MTLSSLLNEGAEWLVGIGVPPDAECVILAQDLVARTQWFEERGLMPVFIAPKVQAEPSIPWLIGLLRVLWSKTNRGCWDAAQAAGDWDAMEQLKGLNGVSKRLRDILESAQQDEAA